MNTNEWKKEFAEVVLRKHRKLTAEKRLLSIFDKLFAIYDHLDCHDGEVGRCLAIAIGELLVLSEQCGTDLELELQKVLDSYKG